MRRALTILLLVYLLAYITFRTLTSEIWQRDGKTYVIFPTESVVIYYVFRPISYLDGMITGMRFHNGPHQ